MRFVIARIDKGGAIGLKSVAQGERRMIEVAAGNLDVPNPQPSLDELAIANCGAELLKGYGKVASGQPESAASPGGGRAARRCPTQSRERKVARKMGYPECGPSGCG